MTENIGTFGEYDPNATPTEEEIAKAISHPVLTHLNKRLEEAQTKYADTYSRLTVVFEEKQKLADKMRGQQYKLEAKLKELLTDEEISPENAQEIADIFDHITLTKQVEIAYTISATVTVEVPFGTDEDTVADNVFVDNVGFYSQDSDYDVLESDFDVEDWNVR